MREASLHVHTRYTNSAPDRTDSAPRLRDSITGAVKAAYNGSAPRRTSGSAESLQSQNRLQNVTGGASGTCRASRARRHLYAKTHYCDPALRPSQFNHCIMTTTAAAVKFHIIALPDIHHCLYRCAGRLPYRSPENHLQAYQEEDALCCRPLTMRAGCTRELLSMRSGSVADL